MTYTLAFDIGGTKIAYGAVADTTPGEATCTGTVPAQPAGSTLAKEFDACVSRALAELAEAGISPVRIGIGAPGVVRGPAGMILRAGPTAPGWQGTDVEEIVARHTDVPVACHNDVRIWAYGEHHLGVGQTLSGRVLYLSLGTGVGGAIVEDGQLMAGTSGSAGEFSELIVADTRGVAENAENVVSGTGLTRYYNVLSKDPDCAGRITFERTLGANDVDLREIMRRYHAGEELAHRVVDGNLRGLGRTLAGLALGLDLDAVVVGGGVAGIGDPVFSAIRQGFADWVVETHQSMPILASQLGGFAPLMGAAAYARDNC